MCNYIDDDDYRKLPLVGEKRISYSKRDLVDRYLQNGWEIISRNPVTLKRGRMVKFFRNGILIDKG